MPAVAGRADIAAGQKVLEDKLNILLQKQQAALDAVNRATAQLNALQSMAQKQAEALTALDAAVQNKINAISVATQQGVISLAQVRGCVCVGCVGLLSWQRERV